MFRRSSLLAVAVLAGGVAVALAVPKNDPAKPAAAASPAGPTVGDFVVRYATAMGLAEQGSKPEDARSALRKAGVIGQDSLDLSAPLTEGDVVNLSGKQLRITTNNPGRSFTPEKLSEFFGVFGSDLRQLGRNGGPATSETIGFCQDPPCKGGKGKGKGHTPTEP